MMAALIESLGIGQQRDEVVSFSWADLLQLEAACCSAIISHQSHLQLSLPVEHSSAESPHVIVLLLPRSALLLALARGCRSVHFVKLIQCCGSLMSVAQLPWVILSPTASSAEIARLAQLLPYIITACVTIEQCQELAISVASLSGVLLLLDHASTICLRVTEDLSRRRPSAGVPPSYFTFTSGSSGSPQCVQCSGSSAPVGRCSRLQRRRCRRADGN